MTKVRGARLCESRSNCDPLGVTVTWPSPCRSRLSRSQRADTRSARRPQRLSDNGGLQWFFPEDGGSPTSSTWLGPRRESLHHLLRETFSFYNMGLRFSRNCSRTSCLPRLCQFSQSLATPPFNQRSTSGNVKYLENFICPLMQTTLVRR